MATPLGLISDIQRFSLHDGPGIRTTVFLKGCPLRCFWCHNPETWRMTPELKYTGRKCVLCGKCGTEFPGLVGADKCFAPTRCNSLERAVALCDYCALEVVGTWRSAEDIAEEITKDADFYARSGGGVTISGGEPLMQADFCRALLLLCKEAGLHASIETSAHAKWHKIEPLLPLLDLIIMDIKHMDGGLHKAATGVSNELILENAKKLSQTGIPMIIRTPIIPGVNDREEVIAAIANFIRDFPVLQDYELMPFHNLADGKYAELGLKNLTKDLSPPVDAKLERLRWIAKVPNRI